ncbi:MAG: hypothetical protein LBE82_02090, partial [Chitinophagaceae bacterium]|nr:hypothetical protein [Chitinophagaceae bacterium]
MFTLIINNAIAQRYRGFAFILLLFAALSGKAQTYPPALTPGNFVVEYAPPIAIPSVSFSAASDAAVNYTYWVYNSSGTQTATGTGNFSALNLNLAGAFGGIYNATIEGLNPPITIVPSTGIIPTGGKLVISMEPEHLKGFAPHYFNGDGNGNARARQFSNVLQWGTAKWI